MKKLKGCLIHFLSVYFVSTTLVLSQVRVLSPPPLVDTLRSAFGSESLPAATATFGAPVYGESFMGALIYYNSIGKGCSTDSKADYENVAGGLPKDISKILLLFRGDCSFTKKAKVGEAFGAQAVMIIDDLEPSAENRDITRTILGDDGTGNQVHIPSVMISNAAATEIIKTIQQPAVVLVQLVWTIPRKSVVEVDFWSESGSIEAQRFLQEYAPHAMQFGGNLRFIPHYYVFSLPKTSFINTSLCWPDNSELCSNPSSLLSSNVTGRAVLQEDVRQLCLFKTTAQKVDKLEDSFFSKEWWTYVQKFPDFCPMAQSITSQKFGIECSVALMKTIVPENTLKQIQACWESQGSVLLDKEKQTRAWSALALRINGARFNGNLDPMLVSRVVCSAYEEAPEYCASIEKGSKIVPPESHSQKSYSQVWFYVILFLGLTALGVWGYQNYLRKSMRNALRQEIMLEVRSQLQDYHRLDDDQIHSTKNQRNKFFPS